MSDGGLRSPDGGVVREIHVSDAVHDQVVRRCLDVLTVELERRRRVASLAEAEHAR